MFLAEKKQKEVKGTDLVKDIPGSFLTKQLTSTLVNRTLSHSFDIAYNCKD